MAGMSSSRAAVYSFSFTSTLTALVHSASGQATFYLDGVQQATASVLLPPINLPTVPVHIGGGPLFVSC